MRIIKSILALTIVAGLCAMATSSFGADKPQPKDHPIKDAGPAAGKEPSKESVTLTGTVKVVKNDKGKVTDVEFSSDDGATYSVKKGPEGRMLEMQDGKKIEVIGSVLDQKGKKLLVVKSYKAVETPAANAPGTTTPATTPDTPPATK